MVHPPKGGWLSTAWWGISALNNWKPWEDTEMAIRSRMLLLAAAGLILVGFLSFGSSYAKAQDRGRVVVTSPGGQLQDAQRRVFFEPFQRETGIKLIEATGPTLAKIKAMVVSNNVEWDVVEVTPSEFLVLAANNLIEKLDYNAFDKKVLEEIDQRVVQPSGIGTIFYSNVIAYNTKKYSKENHPRTWADVWDVKRFPGPRILQAGDYVVTPIEYALLADGVAPDKLYPLDFDRAYRSLEKIKPFVVKWVKTAAAAPQALIDGEAHIAVASHGRIVDLMDKGGPVDFEWNQGLIQVDYWVIPKGAKNYQNAMKFIALASRAEPLANLCKQLPFGPVNHRSFEFMTPEQARRLASYPDNLRKQVWINAEWWAKTDASGKSNVEKNLEMWNAWITK